MAPGPLNLHDYLIHISKTCHLPLPDKLHFSGKDLLKFHGEGYSEEWVLAHVPRQHMLNTGGIERFRELLQDRRKSANHRSTPESVKNSFAHCEGRDETLMRALECPGGLPTLTRCFHPEEGLLVQGETFFD